MGNDEIMSKCCQVFIVNVFGGALNVSRRNCLGQNLVKNKFPCDHVN